MWDSGAGGAGESGESGGTDRKVLNTARVYIYINPAQDTPVSSEQSVETREQQSWQNRAKLSPQLSEMISSMTHSSQIGKC